jgi:serine/threonine protein kinase
VSHSARTEADEESALPHPGDVIAGKYRIDKLVGRGGMGVVLAAQHLALGQTVAIKVLAIDGLDDVRKREAGARFLREGQSAARLTSDHVVRIYDVGTLDSGAPFMVMELLRGEYVVQACDAVAEAHATGIVHRDLKPSNLFVSRRSDGRALVKVLDFGISKAIDPRSDAFEGNLTTTRSVVGSPYYMSPEQVRDAKRVDARTDVWSLGMILYELMTGEPAFNADTLPGICAAIAADAPAPIRERRPDVLPEVEAIVLRCLEKDPAKRFQNIPDLVKALAPFVPQSPASSTLYASRGARSNDGLEPLRYSPTAATIGFAPESGPRRSDAAFAATDPPSPGPSTMASKPSAIENPPPAGPVALDDAKRRDFQKQEDRSSTLVSPSGRTADTHPPSRSRQFFIAGVGLLLLVGAGAVLLRPVATPAPSPSNVPAPADRFTMSIDSMPSGAHVFDGDQIAGTTPFTTVLDNKVVSTSPRKLVLRLDGFEPFEVVQGPSETSVRMSAKLVPLREPAGSTVEQPAGSASAARQKKLPPPKTVPQRSAPTPGTAAPSDIRLER